MKIYPLLQYLSDAKNCPDKRLVDAAQKAWDLALRLGEQNGFRNAQTTVIAPTGTIGLVMGLRYHRYRT